MRNFVKDFSHVAGNGDMRIWYEGGNEQSISNQEIHALRESHEFHGWTASSFISLKR